MNNKEKNNNDNLKVLNENVPINFDVKNNSDEQEPSNECGSSYIEAK